MMRLNVVFLVVSLLFLGGLSSTPTPAQASPVDMSTLTDGDFQLKGIDGKTYGLKSQRGKVVVINFWATWCGPCRQELPKLEALSQSLKDRQVTFYAISADEAGTEAHVKKVALKFGLTMPVLLDPYHDVVSRLNRDSAVPFTIVIDQRGEARHVHSGYLPGDERKVEKEVKALLDEAK